MLHRFLEPRPGLRAGDLLGGAHQGQRRRVERIERLLGVRGGGGGVGIRLLELFARQTHLVLRRTDRRLELGWHERVAPRRLAHLALDGARAFLDGRLVAPRRGAGLAAA